MSCKKIKLSEIDSKGSEVESEKTDNPTKTEAKLVGSNLLFSVTFEIEFWEKIWQIEQELSSELMKIDFKKDKNISAIYNPLDYASDVHKKYMRKYLKKAPKIVFLGMNPGLFGMCQTSASDLAFF